LAQQLKIICKTIFQVVVVVVVNSPAGCQSGSNSG